MTPLGDVLRLRFARWAARRGGPMRGDLTLDRRRIYILPTGPGLMFGAVAFALLSASINFGLQPGFLLTFLVVATGLVGMYDTHANLARLRLAGLRVEPVHAGSPAVFELAVGNPGRRARHSLHLALVLPRRRANAERSGREGPPAGSWIDVPGGDESPLALALPTRRRGRRRCPPVCIETRFPFGLWRAWGYFTPALAAIVYPAPEIDGPPLPAGDGRAEGEGHGAAPDGDEFGGVRPYRPGDPLRAVAWRLAARSEELALKTFEASAVDHVVLDLDRLPAALSTEQRLSRLTHWVMLAEAAGTRYALHLGVRSLAADRGPAHRAKCLHALALYPGGGDEE